jgi:hypothetical protein
MDNGSSLTTEYLNLFLLCQQAARRNFKYRQRLKIDDKRNIDDRIFALVLTPLASCKTKFRVCDLKPSSLIIDK